MYIVHVYNG